MSDEQGPVTPAPPSSGPFAFPPPAAGPTGPGWSPPPQHLGWQPVPGGFYPLSIGRVFDLTFSLYRFGWRTLLGIGLAVEIAMTVAGLLLLVSPQSSAFTDWSTRPPTPEELNAFLSSLLPALLLSLSFFVAFLVLGYIEFGAMTDAVLRIYAGRPASAWASLRRGLGRWRTFVALMLLLVVGTLAVFLVGALTGLVVAFASLLTRSAALAVFLILIVYVATFAALIFFGVRTSMAVPIAMVESAGAMDSLRRSWRLIGGSTWRVIGYYLLFWLLTVVISLIIGTLLNMLINPYQMSGYRIVSIDWIRLGISTVLSSLLGATLAPLTAIPAILLYLDLRFRRGEHINPPGQGSIRPSAVGYGSVPEEQV